MKISRGLPPPKYWYRAHGLTIGSDFPIPELITSDISTAYDIYIHQDQSAERALAAALSASDNSSACPCMEDTGNTPLLIVPEGGAVFRIKGVATFWVRDGREICVAPATGTDQGAVSLFILGSAIGLALLQRGALVLHGASVLTDRGALLFLGPSGIGKSTLAARLAANGFASLGDDTMALWPVAGPDKFVVFPAINAFKLWEDALADAGIATDGLQPVANRARKFYLPNPRPAADRPHPVGGIHLLQHDEHATETSVAPLAPLEAVQRVSADVYRPCFVKAMDLVQRQFEQICELIDHVPVSKLRRPRTAAGNDAVVTMLRCLERGEACSPPG